jgi:hypothetical protein
VQDEQPVRKNLRPNQNKESLENDEGHKETYRFEKN